MTKNIYMLYQGNLLQVFSCFTMDATKWAYLKRFKYLKKGPLSLKYQNVRLYAINPARMCKKLFSFDPSGCFLVSVVFHLKVDGGGTFIVVEFVWHVGFRQQAILRLCYIVRMFKNIALFHKLCVTDCSSVNTLFEFGWILLNLLMWRHLSRQICTKAICFCFFIHLNVWYSKLVFNINIALGKVGVGDACEHPG